MNHPFIHVVGEREFILLHTLGSLFNGLADPLGAVACDLVASNLEDREVADDADHSFWGGVLIFKEGTLEGVAVGALFEFLNFTNEFTNIFKLTVN